MVASLSLSLERATIKRLSSLKHNVRALNHTSTRRMAIANRTCVTFCNQPKHNLATSGESRRYVVVFTSYAGECIWLPQESLRHIFASPGYAPGTIAVNVIWIKRGSNAGQTHRSIYRTHLSSTVYEL